MFNSSLIFLTFLFVSCGSQEQKSEPMEGTKLAAFESSKPEGKSIWINHQYLKCIEDGLPCECLNKVTYTLLNVDLQNHLATVYENNADGGVLYLKEMNPNNYFLSLDKKDTANPFLSMRITGDTLYLNDHGVISLFVLRSEINGNEYNEIIGKINLKALVNRIGAEDQFIKEISSDNLSLLLCNPEIGNINLLSTTGNCENRWIIEKSSTSISIYRFENACGDKSVPFKIKKTLVYSYP